MKIRYASVKNGVVSMVSAVNQSGFIECPEWVRAGCTYDGANFERPKKTKDELFTKEMDALNGEYDKNMAILATKYNIAVARDGSQETAKVESARAEISTLDAQYESDQLAIFNKYYGA